ncbi:hypothetical protein ERX46_15275 [Brumimicrobium glaciale]|uniref:Uncharacterized protein n=1 Tax=Brumimicrobium glaciale TaxID=200475 RepID=A0A4Q4KHF8_9FLAO|nr:hypothetical protein [Brumimicrobium glaciale]RYM32047.1 hypothetical protein ERX46_15275 [Brumimicrobium glaciale]
MTKAHSFHIPVMGIGFTIDTPLKVAQFGMDSVISLVDDELMEKLRKVYTKKFKMNYIEISNKINDYRAKRITSYLNLLKEVSEHKLEELKKSANGIKEYFSFHPNSKADSPKDIQSEKEMHLGSIDVNIMTKVDRENYKDKVQLPIEFNDAHAALRGYANSNLNTSLVFSAGMNPRLFSYIEQFEDFYPNEKGEIKKKIILKVSDYRSALIQGKFLAKKGIWVSEYRIESGLNCGGHAFATNGFLMGPILAEFRDNKKSIIDELFPVLIEALKSKEKVTPTAPLSIKYSAQGGVGTAEEHEFLLKHYQFDAVGWGTPFLLVPEATTVDDKTIEKLKEAKEKDLYLSDISPLGVPFNNLRGNTKDLEKEAKINKKRPGSSCPKKYLAQNKEFTEESICTASRQYQHFKIQELQELDLPIAVYEQRVNKITKKSCICVGLGTSALLTNSIDTRKEGPGVSVCPGPNMAYFSREMTLKEITDHIYNRDNMISRTDRPNMFIKELLLYMKDFKKKAEELTLDFNKKQERTIKSYRDNMLAGIEYYRNMFEDQNEFFKDQKESVFKELENFSLELNQWVKKLELT